MSTNRIIVDHPDQLYPPDKFYCCTIILDLDDTLICVDRSNIDYYYQLNYQIFIRPYAIWFLEQLRLANCEVIIWSAGTFQHVERCLDILDPDNRLINASIVRGSRWYNKYFIVKNLQLIPDRNIDNCLLIENNYEASFRQPNYVVIVSNYDYCNSQDNVLYRLYHLIEQCLQENTICRLNLFNNLSLSYNYTLKSNQYLLDDEINYFLDGDTSTPERFGMSLEQLIENDASIIKIDYYQLV